MIIYGYVYCTLLVDIDIAGYSRDILTLILFGMVPEDGRLNPN
jgi:hypothetical protein